MRGVQVRVIGCQLRAGAGDVSADGGAALLESRNGVDAAPASPGSGSTDKIAKPAPSTSDAVVADSGAKSARVLLKRYSEFDALRHALRVRHGSAIPKEVDAHFPRKRLFASNTSDSVTAERTIKLDAWLQSVLQLDVLADSAILASFLERPQDTVLYSTWTVCPACRLLRHRALHHHHFHHTQDPSTSSAFHFEAAWLPGTVVIDGEGRNIWLSARCQHHGIVRALMHSRAAVAWRTLCLRGRFSFLTETDHVYPALTISGHPTAQAPPAPGTEASAPPPTLMGPHWQVDPFRATVTVELCASPDLTASGRGRAGSITTSSAHSAGASASSGPNVPDTPRKVQLLSALELRDAVAAAMTALRASLSNFERFAVRFRTEHNVPAEELNQVLLHLMGEELRGLRLGVQVPPETMASLADLPDSIFLSPRVYALLDSRVRRGDEDWARQGLVAALAALAAFQDIQVHVQIRVEAPLPNLETFFLSLLRHRAMVRSVTVVLVRSSQLQLRVAHKLARQSPDFDPTSTTTQPTGGSGASRAATSAIVSNGSQIQFGRAPAARDLNDVDVVPVTRLITRACMGNDVDLVENDFFSPLALQLLEPLLYVLGYGCYRVIYPALLTPVTIVVHFADYTSVPLARIFDMELLIIELLPMVSALRAAKYGSLTSLTLVGKAKAALRKCWQPAWIQAHPDMVTVGLDKAVLDVVERVALRSQLLIADRLTDDAAVDMLAGYPPSQ
ncbi:uncharacterized protein MONBRDRAFT_37067 [Monosiga brevicollis MX1]|uniref:PX domain-containing protein n=1 Tax=Monosiga brevicollis TaxID=81824 RepID=A9UZE2_MONBE|nr:uncharacterized protein MONBRDRAFT_37067 [Monosiga brevicollis MX1]EDQ89216.1 predicted protein [Monosiga brevicollis MX1]|eukprot:XP_001745792.1 hypothetical protein [Monosiga brevicollis MX1]